MIGLLLVWLSAAHADPVVDALNAELGRSIDELKLESADGPYYVRYQLEDGYDVHITAQLGGLVSRWVGPERLAGVEVRVGSPELDSANFDSGWRPAGFRSRPLVLGERAPALRTDLWLATDEAYKSAVEALAAKKAAQARKAEPDTVPDHDPSAPHQARAEAAAPFDPAPLEALAIALSARFAEHPTVHWSRVSVAGSSGRGIVVDSLGTEVVQPAEALVLQAVARTIADDGSQLTDTRTWVVRRPEDLPAAEALASAVDDLAARMTRWRDLPVPEDTYIGPVLFEGDAAVALFRYLAVPALQGTPPKEEPAEGSRVLVFGDAGGPDGALAVRRRLLPSGFAIVDDPTADPSLPGAYAYDDEGVAAVAVELVSDGIVRTHFASRTPSEDVPTSNGHGRGAPGELIRGAAAVTRVSVERPTQPKKLKKQALGLAAEYGLDHYLVVRRLSDPSAENLFESPFSVLRFGGAPPALPPPVEVVRVYADGREEAVRGLDFVGVDHRLLRDIVAAHGSTTASYLAPSAGHHPTARGSLPTTLTAPDVLVGEVELAPDRGDAEKPPALPSPLAASAPDG